MACQVLSMGLAVLGIRIAFYTGDTTPLTQNSWDWQAGSPAHRRPAASGVGIEVAEVVPFRGHLSVTKEGVLTRLATATRRSSTLGKRPSGDKPLRALKHSDVLQALAAHPRLSGKTVNTG